MPTKPANNAVAKFPLRLMPSVRRSAQLFSKREGVSLNQFINLAVAEKLAHLEHEEWLRRRHNPTAESRARALQLFESGGNNSPEPGDELPEGYLSALPTP